MQGRGGGSGGKAQRRRLVLARVRQNTQGRRSRLVVPPSTSRLATRTRRCGKIRGKCVDVAGRSGVNASSPSIIVLRIILRQNTVKGEYGIACTGPFAFSNDPTAVVLMELVTPVSKCDDIGEWARGPASDCTSVLPALAGALLYPFQRTPNLGLKKHGPLQLSHLSDTSVSSQTSPALPSPAASPNPNSEAAWAIGPHAVHRPPSLAGYSIHPPPEAPVEIFGSPNPTPCEVSDAPEESARRGLPAIAAPHASAPPWSNLRSKARGLAP